ncbi:MAG: sugar phosphate isomerase/epimerase [Deltaproteobacteria bacterium]|nr:sugar phosphate isomerase/epimerase [Deltaproteobacteria bacterium]
MKHIFVSVPYQLVEPNLKRILSMDIGIEIYLENNLLDTVTTDEVKELSRKLRDYGILCSLHAPYMDLSPGGQDQKIRALSVERLKKAVEIANIINAETIVCHPGYDRWHFDGNVELWFKNSLLSWTEVLKEKEGNTHVLVENVFEETPESLLELLNYFKGKLLFCFDTGHFNVFSKTSLEKWLTPMKKWIKEFHLHDNYGTEDDHMPLGIGNFPFRELRNFVKGLEEKEIIYVAEPHNESQAIESIKRIRDFLW